MSEKTKDAAQAATLPDPEELVEYIAPIDPNGGNRDVVAAVNGEFIQIKRGVPVMIKRKFKEVLDNAAMQNLAALEAQIAALKASEKAVLDM